MNIEKIIEYFKTTNIQDMFLQLAELGIIPIVIAMMAFLFIFAIALRLRPKETLVKSYKRINDRLVEKSSFKFFDYEKIQSELRMNGMIFHYPKLSIPVVYVATKICLGLLVGSLCGLVHFALFFIGFIVGYKVIDFWSTHVNKKDNLAMQADLQFIYNSLSILIKSGVYVGDALSECFSMVKNARLKQALLELSGELLMNVEIKTAITNFQNKFNNSYISSLCVTIMQYTESGMAVDLLADMSEQIKNFRANQLILKKTEMDRNMTICMLVLIADVMGFIIYLCIKEIGSTLISFVK